MPIVLHDSPAILLDRAHDFLLADEAANNMILGICIELRRAEANDSVQRWLLTVEQGGRVAGVAIVTPPRKLLITQMSKIGAAELAEFLSAAAAPVPGVAGLSPSTSDFARSWSQQTQQHSRRQMQQRIYSCGEVSRLSTASGRFRSATLEDRALLVRWFHDFHIAVHCQEANDRCDAILDAKLAAGRLVIWDDGIPVCCASFDRETDHGVAINYVYTPPMKRGCGYATSCVAALTRQRLDAGRTFCCLYTDISNPTSNRIYQRIGYRPVIDAEVWDFATV